MKIYISYFYNVRFLKPNQIPFSTAVWDPKWFHDGSDKNNVFVDKNGVFCGLRIEELNPEKCHATGCPCEYHKTGEGYQSCSFLQAYRLSLRKLNFQAIIDKLEDIAAKCKQWIGFEEEPEIILLVYETPENPCSERMPLIEWFAENGVELSEWEKAPEIPQNSDE